MAISITKKSGSSVTYPTGTQHAIIQGIIVLGTHTDPRWGKTQSRCVIQYELPNSTIEVEQDGKQVELPQIISQTYTLSLYEKSKLYRVIKAACRERLEGLGDDDEFFLHELIGKNLQISIDLKKTKKGKDFYNVGDESELMEIIPRQELTRESIMFGNEPNEDGVIIPPQNVPSWMLDEITSSAEYVAWKEGREDAVNAVQAADAAEELTIEKIDSAKSAKAATEGAEKDVQPTETSDSSETTKATEDVESTAAEEADTDFDKIDLSGVPPHLRETVLAEMKKSAAAAG